MWSLFPAILGRMLLYFETTTLIILWCFVLSLCWTHFAYWQVRRGRAVGRWLGVLPALVLAPLALTLGYRVFAANLLYPVHLFAGFVDLCRAAVAPAVVLLLASGLAARLARLVTDEYAHWREKSFYRVSESYGIAPDHALRRLVTGKALADAWAQCLPWLFGEIIVVEAVFNAPGIGLATWHAAKQRAFSAVLLDVAQLGALYALCALASRTAHCWIGRRLESYA